MHIWETLLDCLISQIKIEYNGTHNSDPSAPLYGRRAYWRLYLSDGTYVCKMTTPVKSINPKQRTLDKLFKAELKRRIEAISEHVTTDDYGRVQIEYRDPYSVKRLLDAIVGKYYDRLNQTNESVGA